MSSQVSPWQSTTTSSSLEFCMVSITHQLTCWTCDFSPTFSSPALCLSSTSAPKWTHTSAQECLRLFLLKITLPTLELLYDRQALAIPLATDVPRHYQLHGHALNLIILLLKQCATFDWIWSEKCLIAYRIRKCLRALCPLYFIYYRVL